MSEIGSRVVTQFKQMCCVVYLHVLEDWGPTLEDPALVRATSRVGEEDKGQVWCDEESNLKELTAERLES